MRLEQFFIMWFEQICNIYMINTQLSFRGITTINFIHTLACCTFNASVIVG